MANKAISELPQALNVNNQDLFVLEQSGIAKKLTAETFITEQGIIDALAEALDGHGGISSVTLSSVSGRIRTYLITFTDGTSTTFQVLDGNTIDRIAKTSTAGLVDTYTVFMSDGTTTFFTVTNGADGTVSEAMLNDALKNKAPVITETTESSAIANFTDGADDMVMHNVVAEINPVQSGSGDPSPDNIRPITGWTGCNVTRTGANLFDKSNVVHEHFINGNDISAGNTDFAHSDYIPVKSGQVYYCSPPWYAGISVIFFYDKNKVNIGRGSNNTHLYTTPDNCCYVRINMHEDEIDTAFLNYPSTNTVFTPYQGNTVAVDWTTEAGTVYGGTIDVATGLLTVEYAKFDNPSSYDWQYDANYANGLFRFRYANNFKSNGKLVCSMYPYKGIYSQMTNNSCGYIFSNHFAIKDDSYNGDVSAFKSGIADMELIYELATPLTYQLTPQEVLHTLYGVNNVWTDIGNVSVKYPADTKMFIEKLTMPTEDDLVANQAITSGQYFMIGNSLYLALANIASGAQITIGTNAQRVSLADALNTINA